MKTLRVIAVVAAGLALALLATGVGPLGAASGTLSPLAASVLLYAITIPIVRKVSGRHKALEQAILIGLGLKLLGAFARYYVNVKIFGSLADSQLYDEAGKEISQRLSNGFVWPGDFSYRGEGTTRLAYITGLLYTVTGANLVTGYVVFSWFGFLGYLGFFKAFVTAQPDINRVRLARFMFFMPSLVFWPSSVGKEAWMVLCLGVATWGIARLSTGRRDVVSMILAAGGLLAGGWVRPHLPVIASVALTAAFLWPTARNVSRSRQVLVALFSSVIVATSLSAIAQQYGTSASGLLDVAASQSSTGGSEFKPVVVSNPINFVPGIVSTLFRPFIFEARSLVQLATALELTLLLVVVVRRRKDIQRSVALFRDSTFTRFAVLYLVGFAAAFSRIANFGLLSRQRAQCWPLLLFLLVVVQHAAEKSARTAQLPGATAAFPPDQMERSNRRGGLGVG